MRVPGSASSTCTRTLEACRSCALKIRSFGFGERARVRGRQTMRTACQLASEKEKSRNVSRRSFPSHAPSAVNCACEARKRAGPDEDGPDEGGRGARLPDRAIQPKLSRPRVSPVYSPCRHGWLVRKERTARLIDRLGEWSRWTSGRPRRASSLSGEARPPLLLSLSSLLAAVPSTPSLSHTPYQTMLSLARAVVAGAAVLAAVSPSAAKGVSLDGVETMYAHLRPQRAHRMSLTCVRLAPCSFSFGGALAPRSEWRRRKPDASLPRANRFVQHRRIQPKRWCARPASAGRSA